MEIDETKEKEVTDVEEKFITEIEIFFGQKLKHKAQMLEMKNWMGQIKHTKEYITNRLDTAGETIRDGEKVKKIWHKNTSERKKIKYLQTLEYNPETKPKNPRGKRNWGKE